MKKILLLNIQPILICIHVWKTYSFISLTQGFLPQRQEEPHFIGTNQDFVFESDLHYGTYSGLRYG